MSGRRRSSRTMSGSAARERLAPVATRSTSNPSRAKPLRERLGDRVFVLDEQDVHGTSSHTDACAASVVYRFFAKAWAARWPDPCPAAPSVRCMKRTHALLIALALAVAVVAGMFAGAADDAARLGARAPQRQLAQYRAADPRARPRRGGAPAELRRRPPAIAGRLPASLGAAAAAPQTVDLPAGPHRSSTSIHRARRRARGRARRRRRRPR